MKKAVKSRLKWAITAVFLLSSSIYSQSFQQNRESFGKNPQRLEFLLKNSALEETEKKLSLIPAANEKSKNSRFEETIISNFPLSNEVRGLLNFYYELSEGYQKFKKFRDSFRSYELANNEKINTTLYLINVGNLKNINEYGLLLNLRVKLP